MQGALVGGVASAVAARVAQLIGMAAVASAPASLVSCVRDKYLDEEHATVDAEFALSGFVECSPVKEFLAQRGLRVIVLNHMHIADLGDASKLAELTCKTVDMDLAWNDIRHWKHIAYLMETSPRMRMLNLSHNPLAHHIDCELPLSNVQHLVLNGTHLPISTLRRVLPRFPRLSELHLSNNDFTYDDSEAGPMSESVKELHINRCGFTDWARVVSLMARFPNVEHVLLAENPIELIAEDENHDVASSSLTSLHAINISKSNVSCWSSIDSLSLLPSLRDLRIHGIPLLEPLTEEEKRHLVISRLDKLEVLNASAISPEQREQSERFFIRYYQDREDRPTQHYKRLVEKHGEIERLVKIDLTPRSQAKVLIQCDEKNYKSMVTVRLGKSVNDLMKFVERVTSIPVARQRVFFIDVDVNHYGPTELRFPAQLLRELHIEDGDQFIVQSKFVPNRRRTVSQKECGRPAKVANDRSATS